ncbi:MOSC N-terminal beta barrel domain-containing protein [Streptomyces platensis]|uniref:MOSC domain-containing protein n=1 Tax=Streptomyces platensis TaxID=58346 RepID=UPI0022589859|nr:MOSC N-terminal beta barrel domain-containing protein [Streptomyces platensis]MCX4636581.1 MOSC N-terminal beta barrel domain-containing protein [Streptomyces platensis]
MATVVELISYPVKGCAGAPATEAELTPAGLAHDRSFLVVGPGGVFRSQRTDPRLAVIRPAVEAGGAHLTLHAPGCDPLHLDVDTGAGSAARSEVEMFGTPYRAVDQGDRVARWLSEVLGAESRLVRVPPEHGRVTDGLTPGTSGFADSSAVHVLSRATLDDLNRRIAAAGRTPVPMDRFRPNFVVDGWQAPQTEDRVRRVTVGGGVLGFTKLAIRCAVTLVNQQTGGRAGPEPLRTLAAYRRVPEGGVAFGSKFAVVGTGKVTVGDAFEVTEWGTD